MVDSSNSRVIEVINFLAARPTEAFTLSELAERLSLSHGSAHRVLKTLTDASYLSRHPKHKTYSLGLALVAVGQSALERHHAVAIAGREMVRLAEELGVQCVATAIVDNQLLSLAKEGVSQTHDGVTRVGERRPFMPPLGLGHVAWAEKPVVDAYLAKAPHGLAPEAHAHLLQALGVIRSRGYSMAAFGAGMMALRKVVTDYADNRREQRFWEQMQLSLEQLSLEEIQLLSLENVETVRVGHISVPVFTPTGEVALEISLTGMPKSLGSAEVERYAERLRVAAAIVTSETRGRMPRHRE